MERFIEHSGEKFKVRYYFDTNVKERVLDPQTGKSFEIMKGDISGIEIYSPSDGLIGCFDYINFDNDNVIRKIIEENY